MASVLKGQAGQPISFGDVKPQVNGEDVLVQNGSLVTASSNTVNRKVPIEIDGVTYYLLASTEDN